MHRPFGLGVSTSDNPYIKRASSRAAQSLAQGRPALPASEPVPRPRDGPLLHPELHRGVALHSELHGLRRSSVWPASRQQAALARGHQHPAGIHDRRSKTLLGSDIHWVHGGHRLGFCAGWQFAQLLGAGAGVCLCRLSGKRVAPASFCPVIAALPRKEGVRALDPQCRGQCGRDGWSAGGGAADMAAYLPRGRR